jgi:hypothetical protein
MEDIEVEKKVKTKARRVPRPAKKKNDTPICGQQDTNLVTSAKLKQNKQPSKTSFKKNT